MESDQTVEITTKSKNLMAQNQKLKKIQPEKCRFSGVFWPKNVKKIKTNQIKTIFLAVIINLT